MPALKFWLQFAEDWRQAPMAYWVHIEQDGKSFQDAEVFDPPAPKPVPGRGYQVVCVEVLGTVLHFSSPEQMHECCRVLSLKPLPTTRQLSAVRNNGTGPNRHWLSRLPADVKSPKGRLRVVKAVRAAVVAVAPKPPA